MNLFSQAIAKSNSADFNNLLTQAILDMDMHQLPLQQALSQSSHVSDSKINVIILNTSTNESRIIAKVGVFYLGVIAGSCCSDDPTPVDEIQEYCELEFSIDKTTAEFSVTLLD